MELEVTVCDRQYELIAVLNHSGKQYGTGLFLLDQEPTLGGGLAGAHGRPRS